MNNITIDRIYKLAVNFSNKKKNNNNKLHFGWLYNNWCILHNNINTGYNNIVYRDDDTTRIIVL